jgi:hypothetical protein
MRLWTLHPQYLDPVGLVALWREALLAQKVLTGATRGYRHHPQLERFRGTAAPLLAIGSYLSAVQTEAKRRGYAFDASRITTSGEVATISVTDGQLRHEWTHLLEKLRVRSPALARTFGDLEGPSPHPLFTIVPGPIASWERPPPGRGP